MSYQNDPIGTIQSDLNAIEKELEGLNKVYRAASVLLEPNRDRVELSQMTVQEAAQVVANADLNSLIGADLKSITLPEIVTELDRAIEAVTEERDSFVNAQNKLFAYNRGQTILWIHDRIKKAKTEIKQCEADHKIDQWTAAERELETLQACLKQLGNVKSKYVE